MKVCVVNPDFYRSSGVTVAIKRIHASVADFGIENFFVTCSDKNQAEDNSWMPAGTLSMFQLMSLNIFILLPEIFLFFSWVRRNKINVIHVHHRRLAIIFKIFGFLFRGSILYTGNLTYRFSFLFWLFSPSQAVAVSKSVEINIRKTTRTSQIDVIGNPTVFPDDCPHMDLEKVRNRAICVARLDPVKSHGYLIEAWHLLISKGYKYELILIGEGSLKQSLQDRVKELQLDSSVIFKGYTSDVNAQFSNCLFSILVSEVEGQGIVTIEAASAGRASLLTDVDGSRDCLPPVGAMPNGLVHGDVTALANALEYWFTHPESVMQEGQIFFDFHKNTNSADAVGPKYVSLYRHLVENY